MTLKRLLWVLGFDYDELWPSTDSEQLQQRDEHRDEGLRRQCRKLLRQRLAIAGLERRSERYQQCVGSLATDALKLERMRQRVVRLRELLEQRQQRYQQRLAKIRRLVQRSTRSEVCEKPHPGV